MPETVDVAIAPSITALMLYAAWAVFLAILVVVWRISKVMRGQANVTEFTAGIPHGTEAYWRAYRAHLNILENLPLFGAVVLAGAFYITETGLYGTLAFTVFFARVAQSVIHLISASPFFINLRFLAYLVQMVAIIWMIALILPKAASGVIL